MENLKQFLEEGRGILGIEFGSTRIKAVVIDDHFQPVLSGGHNWENRLSDGIWTYTMEDIHSGLQDAYRELQNHAREQADARLTSFRAIGISGMMHGYLPFDERGELLSMYRTWRNTNAHEAAERLTQLFGHNIPDRWSSAQLYDSILHGEEHVERIRFMTTLAGYIHFLLTGEKVIGIGDASGIFPIDSQTGDYREDLLQLFEKEIASKGCGLRLRDVFPRVLKAGAQAGVLTKEGAALLDPEGDLKPGILLCPPEGDAATGMIATNSVAARTGNLSAGTSDFLMAVMEQDIRSLHREIEQISAPDGSPVAMVHANNCTTDISAWVRLFKDFADLTGNNLPLDELYGLLYRRALEGEPDAGGIYSYNFHAGEFIAGTAKGCPMVIRRPDAELNLSNFMRAQLYGTFAVLRIGTDLLRSEGIQLDTITGHGGLFKTPAVAQRVLAGALNTPVCVMATAGEGGAWGIAILAAFLLREDPEEELADFLNRNIFDQAEVLRIEPEASDVEGYDQFMEGYRRGLRAAAEAADVI